MEKQQVTSAIIIEGTKQEALAKLESIGEIQTFQMTSIDAPVSRPAVQETVTPEPEPEVLASAPTIPLPAEPELTEEKLDEPDSAPIESTPTEPEAGVQEIGDDYLMDEIRAASQEFVGDSNQKHIDKIIKRLADLGCEKFDELDLGVREAFLAEIQSWIADAAATPPKAKRKPRKTAAQKLEGLG